MEASLNRCFIKLNWCPAVGPNRFGLVVTRHLQATLPRIPANEAEASMLGIRVGVWHLSGQRPSIGHWRGAQGLSLLASKTRRNKFSTFGLKGKGPIGGRIGKKPCCPYLLAQIESSWVTNMSQVSELWQPFHGVGSMLAPVD